jgi:catechol 2,3-dioxygenase-like lactoylglutathione lyase family enzyme
VHEYAYPRAAALAPARRHHQETARMTILSLHHAAYRCKDAQQTVDFYTQVLGLEFTMAMAEDKVPSTGEHSPYMHIFFRMADGSHVAFFELPEAPQMGWDPNTPDWVQHLALRVPDVPTLLAYKAKVEAAGVAVLGPTDHTIFKSIYFFDPSGHRLELTANVEAPAELRRLGEVRDDMLKEWNQTHRPPRQASFVHGQGAAAK